MSFLFSLCNVIDIMSIYFSMFDKMNKIGSYTICSTTCVKFVAYADGIINIINTCCTPLKILARNLIKIGMMSPVFLILRLYGRVLKYFLDIFKQSKMYGGTSRFVGHLGENWKVTTLLPIISAFVSRDLPHVFSFRPLRTFLGLVTRSISRVVSPPFYLMLMAFILLFNGSCKIAINGLRMIYDEAMKGWERMMLSSSICENLKSEVMVARRKLQETERDLRRKLEETERRAENEAKRRREASDDWTSQIRQVYERLAIVEEELRSKCVHMEDLENLLFEDKLNECWRGWEVKREELVGEQDGSPYYA